jgi:PIN domain nuclease of toxin-antitoxin system
MSVFVLDSNIVPFYLREHEQVSKSIETAISKGDELLIAPFAYYEVRESRRQITRRPHSEISLPLSADTHGWRVLR